MPCQKMNKTIIKSFPPEADLRQRRISLRLKLLAESSILLLVPLCLILACVPVRAGETLSLEESLHLAVQNSARLLSSEQSIIIARQRVKEATFRFFPQISFSGTLSRSDINYPMVLPPEFGSRLLNPGLDPDEDFYTARSYLHQAVYTGGRNVSTLHMAQTALKQAKTSYEAVKRDEILNLKNVFYRMMYCKENSKLSKKWLTRMKAASASLGRRGISGWEDIEIKSLLNRMESQVQKAVQELSLARLEFLKALNRELDSQVDIAGDFKVLPVKLNLVKAIVWAMELRPELKSEIYRAQMDAIAVNLALSRRYPTVYLGAGYDFVGHEFPLKTTSWEASLSIHFPLSYDFWTQIQQKRAEQRQGNLKRAELQDKVRLEVRQAWKKLDFWQSESMRRQSAWMELSEQYESQSLRLPPSVAALRAINSLYQSQRRFIDGIRQQLLARANLEWAVGRGLVSE